MHGRGTKQLRRRNWLASGLNRKRNQRGNGEEDRGYKGEGHGAAIAALSVSNHAAEIHPETAVLQLQKNEDDHVIDDIINFFFFC